MSAVRVAVLGGVLVAAIALAVLKTSFSQSLPAGGPRVFITLDRDTGPDAISVIYLPNRTLQTTVPLDCGGDCKPFGLALSPAGDRLYVSNSQADSVSVIDLATLQVTATWSLKTADNQGTRTPRELAVSPDGTRLYVSNQASGTVSVLDTSSGRILAETPVGLSPRGIDLLPDGRVVVVTQGNDTTPGTVAVLDLEPGGYQVVLSRTVESGFQPVAVKAVGSSGIFVAEQGPQGRVEWFNFDLQPVLEPIVVGNGPVGIVYDGRVQRLYVACGADQDIWQINLSNWTSSGLGTRFQPNPPTPFNGLAFYPAEDPAQAQLVVVGGSGGQSGGQTALVGFVTVSNPGQASSVYADEPGTKSMPWGVVAYTGPPTPTPTPSPSPTAVPPSSTPGPACTAPGRSCLFLPAVIR